MPIGQLHKDRKKKNFLVLGIIVAWVALIFVISVLKMTANS